MIQFLEKFELTERAHRVVFGESVSDVLRRELGSAPQRYFVISTTTTADLFERSVAEDVRRECAGRFADAVPHVPEEIARRAADQVMECDARLVVAFGGGSSIDTAKAVSHWLHLPILAVPTNFSGSEVTWNFGLTSAGVKRTVFDPDVLPRVVIYDPTLLVSLGQRHAVCSGINALAHAVEGMYAGNANPLTSAAAVAGVSNLITGLQLRQSASSWQANAQCLAGSWLCGEVLAKAGMGLHHRICHVLGGSFGLPHAETHTALLPYSVAFNECSAPQLSALADLFGSDSCAAGIAAFAKRLGAPGNLRELGFHSQHIARAAQLAVGTPIANPRAVTLADVEAILAHAIAGTPLD